MDISRQRADDRLITDVDYTQHFFVNTPIHPKNQSFQEGGLMVIAYSTVGKSSIMRARLQLFRNIPFTSGLRFEGDISFMPIKNVIFHVWLKAK